MNVTQIISEFGSYYINNPANSARIVRGLNFTQATDTKQAEQIMADSFTPVMTDDTIWRGAESRITRLLQSFQKAWTPTGTATFVPVEVRMFKLKADFQDSPDDLEESWLGFLASNNLDRKTWPIVRYLVEELIIPQIREDFEMNEVYKGVYAAPTTGTPGAAGATMNGIGKIIADHITNTRITPITTGVLETDPKLFVQQINEYARDVDARYKSAPMFLNMDKELAFRYEEGFDQLYNENYLRAPDLYRVKYSEMRIRGWHGMSGSSRIWATPKQNVVRLMKKSQNMTQVRIENVDRLIKLFTDFFAGVGFLIPELVFTNEQV